MQCTKAVILMPFLLVLLHFVEGKVEWYIENKISKNGDDLKLMCSTNNTTHASGSTKRWAMFKNGKEAPLALNGATFENVDPGKYNATVEDKGFGLVIKNFTEEEDLNITYQCNYGFIETKIILQRSDIFEVNEPRSANIRENANNNKYIIAGIVVAFVLVAAVLSIVIFLLKKGKLKNFMRPSSHQQNHAQGNTGDEEIGLSSQHEETEMKLLPDQSESNGRVPHETDSGARREGESTPLMSNGDANHHDADEPEFMEIINENGHHQQQNLPISNSQDDNSGGSNTAENKLKLADSNFQHNNSAVVTSVTGTDNQSSMKNGLLLLTGGVPVEETTSQNTSSSVTGTNGTQSDTTSATVSPISEENRPIERGFQYSHSDCNQQPAIDRKNMKYPAYKKKNIRLESFPTSSKWTLSQPLPEQMATAGFFYNGCQTYAQCFSCGHKRLWCEGDDPLDESFHENCSHLKKLWNESSVDKDQTIPMSVLYKKK